MGARNRVDAVAPYIERLAANEYVQERLSEAVENLRASYARASRRSAAKAAQDRKLQRRLGRGLSAGRDALVALQTGRPPKRRGRRRVIVLGVLAIAGAAAASGPIRRKLTEATPQPSPTAI
jgi:hypothetical protein